MKRFLIIFACLFYVPLGMLCLLLLFTCEEKIYSYNRNKPTEFFKIKEGWSDEARSHKYESFVLSNPPNDSSLLRKIVEEYNQQTISLDTIKKYEYYERIFYLENKCLTRDNEEASSCHFYGKEKLIKTLYYSYDPVLGTCEYSYYFGRYFRDNNGYHDVEIENIDLFFEEGRRNLSE
jgi:hypothetical protein